MFPTATIPASATPYSINYSYAGDTNFTSATDSSTALNVNKAASTTTITANTPNPSTVGQSVSVSFKVTGSGTPTGSVTVTATLNATTVTCSGTLSSGTGSCSLTLNTAGTWTLTATYAGDNNFSGSSTAAGVSQVVNPATSTLKFTPSALNFGTLYVGQTQFEFLTLTNTDGHMITFTNFNIASIPGDDSNGFFGVSFCPHTLNPGRSCTIIMGFTADSNVTKTHAATLVVTDNAPLSPQSVPLSATVINPVARLSTNNLNFGRQKVGTTSAPQMVTLTSAGTTALIISNLKISGDYAFAPGTTCANNQTLAPGAKCTIAVTFTPSRTGDREGTVFIFDNAQNSPSNINLDGTGK